MTDDRPPTPETAVPAATPGTSVMAGGGWYNDHSVPQHVAGDYGLPLLRTAAESVPLSAERGVLVADYGSSQGRNSLRPMRVAIDALRARLVAAPISIVHTDLPDNDFAALFTTLRDDPLSYLRDEAGVFAYAAGRSFYERIFPPARVSLGWTSITVHWLSSVPVPMSRHIFSPLAEPHEREAYAKQAEADWRDFLCHRKEELVTGGRLVVVGSGADADGRSGAEGLMQIANAVLLEMVGEGSLGLDEYEQMALPTYYRSREEFIAPLRGGPLAEAFELEACSEAVLPDPLWSSFRQVGDLGAYAAGVAGFLRAFSEPSLFGSIAARRSAQVAADVAEEFYARVRDAIARRPETAACGWRLVLLSISKRV